MNATRRNLVLLLAAGMAGMLVSDVYAQRGGGRGRRGFTVSRVDLSSLPEVQANLMLTAEQKTKASEIAEALSSARREAFQQGGGGGDFTARMEQLNKLNAEHTEKLVAALDEKQRTRLDELFVQVNGAVALTDQNIAKSLALTDEQTQKVSDVIAESRQAMRDAFQNQAGPEERQKLFEERNEKLLAVLTDEQKQNFEKMKGDALDIDLSQLRRRGN
jgi:Spy/CpxP family protein refolding chaperone